MRQLISLLLLPLLTSTVTALSAQDLFTALGGVRTPGIQVTTADRGVILRVRDRGIIERPIVETVPGGGEWAPSYAYALTVPHFTFVVDTALTLFPDERVVQRVVRFFDAAGELVYRIDDAAPEVVRQRCVNRRRGSYCVVEVSLADVPPILLDQVAQVDITARIPNPR